MSFRRDGKSSHHESRAWSAWVDEHRDQLVAIGLPPGTYRSRGDWGQLLLYGYWCDGDFGTSVRRVDFILDDLTAEQQKLFSELVERAPAP